MSRLPRGWISELPSSRLLGEYSMWSADLVHLARDIARVQTHADILHIDVADGVFAPAFLFFPDLVARMRGATSLPFHIHLMVDDAVLMHQIDQFAEAGADLISFHVENDSLAGDALDRIAVHGIAAGMVLRVETPVERVRRWLPRLDALTLLGTAIGVKGQSLDPAAGDRLEQAAQLVSGAGRRILLCADGGIRENTVPLLRKAGAETVVLGSLAFGADDLAARMAWLHAL